MIDSAVIVCFEVVNQFSLYLSYSALGLHFNAAYFVHTLTPNVLYEKHTNIRPVELLLRQTY